MANINQWKVGDIISASKLNEMVNAINSLLQQEIPGIDTSNLITTEQLTTILAGYSDVGHTHTIAEIVDLVLPTVPTKLSQLENDTDYATITQVNQAIANAQLGGGEGTAVDLSGLGADLSLNGQTLKLKNSNGVEIGTGVTLPEATNTIDAYTKTETDNRIQDYTGGKKQVYLTQTEYDLLTEVEKNDATKVYNITDATEQVIPTDLTIDSNNLLQLKDSNGNAIGTGVTVSTTSGGSSSYTLPTASRTVLGGIKVGNRLSIDSNGVLSADLQEGVSSGGTVDEVILTSPGGHKFKLIVNDEGALSTEEVAIYGNILVSVSELSINEGGSGVFTVSLSQVPTNIQTITIASNNTDVTVSPSSIDISDTNPHTITVTASEDDDYDNDSATLTLSSLNVSSVTINVTVVDNDTAPETPETPSTTYTNYIYNSDTFTNPTTGNAVIKGTYYWASDVTMEVQDGVATIANNKEGANGSLTIRHGFADNNVYYVQFKVKSNTRFSAGTPQSSVGYPDGASDWTTISYVYTDTNAYSYGARVGFANNGKLNETIQIKEPMKINLTEIYGSGNEPTKEVCDTTFTTYVSGLVG